MDCIASRGMKTMHFKAGDAPDLNNRISGLTYVTPDTRDKFKSQGYMPIGATNSAWNEMYVKAMSQATAMIMAPNTREANGA